MSFLASFTGPFLHPSCISLLIGWEEPVFPLAQDDVLCHFTEGQWKLAESDENSFIFASFLWWKRESMLYEQQDRLRRQRFRGQFLIFATGG